MDKELHKTWTSWQKFGFYFLFSYYFLYAFPQVFHGIFAFFDGVLEHYYSMQDSFVSFVGEKILRLGYYEPNYNSGSGDQPFFYVRQLVFIFMASFAAFIWFFVAKKYSSHQYLYSILRTYLRYFLAAILLSYGLSKVFPSQMPPLTPIQLTQPYGHFSPMGVAWAFMATSATFQIFTGLIEVVAASLLFFRRTTLLGALLATVVLSGVVAFNFCYDIPVKINSVNYLLIAIILLLHDYKSLENLFFYRKEFNPQINLDLLNTKKQRKVATLLKYSYIIYLFFIFTNDAYSFYFTNFKELSQHPLYGVYDVELFIRNNDTIPLLKGDKSIWDKLVLSYPKVFSIRDMNDSLLRFPITEFDSTKQVVSFLTNPEDSLFKSTLYYTKKSGHLTLKGNIGKDSIFIKSLLIPNDNYLLLNRGFHWINEKPFNR